jgi:hypothetical protein
MRKVPKWLIPVRSDSTGDGTGKPAGIFPAQPPSFHDIGKIGRATLIKAVRHYLLQPPVALPLEKRC